MLHLNKVILDLSITDWLPLMTKVGGKMPVKTHSCHCPSVSANRTFGLKTPKVKPASFLRRRVLVRESFFSL
jgi:hypothetical protein